jgi:hypothetical protein
MSKVSSSIFDLGSEKIKLKYPITVIISREEYYEDEEEFAASWPEVEVAGLGLTEACAINDLKDKIVELYEELLNISDESLGKLPKRWKRALNAAIEKING